MTGTSFTDPVPCSNLSSGLEYYQSLLEDPFRSNVNLQFFLAYAEFTASSSAYKQF